jgi:hypothetical protein
MSVDNVFLSVILCDRNMEQITLKSTLRFQWGAVNMDTAVKKILSGGNLSWWEVTWND